MRKTGARAFAGVEAAILCGGLGTRLAARVADRPKVLALVRGRPFLAYVLEQLAAAGVARAVLCTGYRAEQVVALRRSFQDVMEPEMREVVERALGRRVVAFLSQVHLEPDLATEIFFLGDALEGSAPEG